MRAAGLPGGATLTWRGCAHAPRAALWSSNQRKIEISRTVRERVMHALSLSPDDDVALHILGRWEYEMACVGFAVRMVVKMVYGGLEVGSLTEAHRCLARAIELRPERLVHRVVMARILQKQGCHDEAVLQLEAALSLQVEDINASHERAEAARMMLKLGRPVQFASAPVGVQQPPPQEQPAARGVAPVRASTDLGSRAAAAAGGCAPRRCQSEDGGRRASAGAVFAAAAC